jgi:hypothetical protein
MTSPERIAFYKDHKEKLLELFKDRLEILKEDAISPEYKDERERIINAAEEMKKWIRDINDATSDKKPPKIDNGI